MNLAQKTKTRLSNAFRSLFIPSSLYIYPHKTYQHHKISYAQEGEDIIMSRLLGNDKKSGFYVDIGAHHPQRFSNTYLFYLRGWRGINIDAMPGSMQVFNQLRPEDINVEAAISVSQEGLTYYMFNEPALNGFSANLSELRNEQERYKIIDKKDIKARRLSDVLDEYLPKDQKIDILSIDVEGLDHDVLLSNDWSKYKPEYILVEELMTTLGGLKEQSETFSLLKRKGYELFAKAINTSFYRLLEI